MKVIITLRRHNKDANAFCKEVEMTPQEYDHLKEIFREVNNRASNECLSAYIHQI